MAEDIDAYIAKGKTFMDDAIDHLQHELLKIRTGKAAPAMLNGIMIDYYGSQMPISQVANVATADARTLTIQPWEKSMLNVIERGIFEANLGITPQNDGEIIRLTVPPLTEERRRDLVKQGKALGEEAKVSLRNARHKMMDFVKNEVKDGFPEDAGKRKEAQIEKLVKDFYEKVDKIIANKEVDIMTV